MCIYSYVCNHSDICCVCMCFLLLCLIDAEPALKVLLWHLNQRPHRKLALSFTLLLTPLGPNQAMTMKINASNGSDARTPHFLQVKPFC